MKPEPVGYYYNGRFSTEKNAPGIGVYGVPVYTAPPQPKTEQEPVAWGIANTRPTEKQPLMMVMLDKPKPSHLVVPLYTAPPKKEWVGLTKEEMDYIERMTLDKGDAIRLTAVALQEKNGG